MSTSILNDVKHSVGLLPEDTSFDTDILMYINGAIGTLTQLGVGPVFGYTVTGPENVWSELYTDPRLNGAMSFIFLKVDQLFKPERPGPVIAAIDRQLEEMSFRLMVAAGTG